MQIARRKGNAGDARSGNRVPVIKKKQRQAAADYRAERVKQTEQEEKGTIRKKKAAETKAKRKKERQEVSELRRKAEKGDKFALLKLALINGDMFEYWRLRKEMILEEDEKTGYISNIVIGGISVYAGDFEYQIMAQLEEKKSAYEAKNESCTSATEKMPN